MSKKLHISLIFSNFLQVNTWIQIVEKWIDSITRQSNYDNVTPLQKSRHTIHPLYG